MKTSQIDPINLTQKTFTYIDISSIDKDTKVITNTEIIPIDQAPSRARKVIQFNDVLVSSVRPNLNGVAIVPQQYNNQIASTGFCILRAKNTLLDPLYLFYFTQTNQFVARLTKLSTGAGYPAISEEVILETEIPLPPFPEQQRIAAILQKADRIRRLRRYARQLSDGYLQSVFLEMFGDPETNQKKWQTVAASEIYEIQLGKMRSEKEITGKFLHQYLRNVNVQWGYLDLTDIKEMDFTPKEMGKYLLRKGDILVCEGGEVGRTAVFNGEVQKCAYQNALHRLRAKSSQINTDYFVHYMKVACDFGIISKLTSKVTIAHFTAEKFIDLQIMLPPLGLQETFSEICKKVYALKSQQKESERQAEHLFQSLLHQAFQGDK